MQEKDWQVDSDQVELLLELEQLCRVFCRRVEDGEVRSVRTYNGFMNVLNALDRERQ